MRIYIFIVLLSCVPVVRAVDQKQHLCLCCGAVDDDLCNEFDDIFKEELCSLQEGFDTLQKKLSSLQKRDVDTLTFKHEGNTLVGILELPEGITAADVTVSIEDGMLAVSAVKKMKEQRQVFECMRSLPCKVSVSDTKAELQGNKLKISMPKQKSNGKIPVTAVDGPKK